MSVVDDAIAKLQDYILACTTVAITHAPDYPEVSAARLPVAITHLVSGQGQADTADQCRMLLTANVDVHFSRASMKDAYQKIDALAVEYLKRLAGDPKLGNTVDTIVFPVTFTVNATTWGSVETQLLSFTVQFKELDTPIAP